MNREELQSLLDELRVKHGVVGATLGVLNEGGIEAVGSGLLNLDTAVACTPDSVFQIGSIGKVFTTTLIMQLVDQGRLGLDDPVVTHLRDFRLADRACARSVTVRQLLNHTSGIDGDFFAEDDPEGPSTASYLRKMCLLGNLYPPGKGPVTYCNAGFVVAGRIVEILTGMTWAGAITRRILRPLGLRHAFAEPREALRYRCAIGHVFEEGSLTRTRVAPVTYLSLSMAPAGSVLSMSVEDLLNFARVHMANGKNGDGKPLLSEASARRMREELTEVPPFSQPGVTHWGLGWAIGKSGTYDMAGHDGGTIGQYTYLRTFPSRGTAFALFTNSPSLKLFTDVEARLTERLAGASPPGEPPARSFAPDANRYIGRYAGVAAEFEVQMAEGKFTLEGLSRMGGPALHATLEPYSPDVFVQRAPGHPADGQKVAFVGESGPAAFIRMGFRMVRRTGK